MSSSSHFARGESSVLHLDSRPSTFCSSSSSRLSAYSNSCLEYGLEIMDRFLTEGWPESPSQTQSFGASPSSPHLPHFRHDEHATGVHSDYPYPTPRTSDQDEAGASLRRTAVCASEADSREKQERRRGAVFASETELTHQERSKCRRRSHLYVEHEADYDSSGDEGSSLQHGAGLLTPPESSWEDDSDCDVSEGAGPWVMPTDVVDCYMSGWDDHEQRLEQWRTGKNAPGEWPYPSPETFVRPSVRPSRYSQDSGNNWEGNSTGVSLGEETSDSTWFDDDDHLPTTHAIRPIQGVTRTRITRPAVDQQPSAVNSYPRGHDQSDGFYKSRSVTDLKESSNEHYNSSTNMVPPSLRFTHPTLLSKRFSTKPTPRIEQSELRKMRQDGPLRSFSSAAEGSLSAVSSPSLRSSNKLYPFRNDSAGELVPEARLTPAYSSSSPSSSIRSPPMSPALGASRRYHYTKSRGKLPSFGEESEYPDMIPPSSIISRRDDLSGKRISKQASMPGFNATWSSERRCDEELSAWSPEPTHLTLEDAKSTISEGDLARSRKKKQRASKIGQFMGKVLSTMGGRNDSSHGEKRFASPQTPRTMTFI